MARVARREAVVRQAEVHVAPVDADRFCITAAADDDGFDGSARARNPADLTLLRLVELGEVDVRRVDGEPAGRVLSAGERGHRAGRIVTPHYVAHAVVVEIPDRGHMPARRV